MLSMVGPVLDARRSIHLPPPGAHGAYTVVRTRSVTTIATNTAGQRTVLIAGQWQDSAASPQVNCLPFHAVYGVGTAVPGTTESYIVDPLLSGAAAGAYNLSLHAMTVVVTADGSATSSIGTFYMGAIPSRVNRLAFGTFAAMGANLVSRREMLPITAYQALAESERYSVRTTFPMDLITYQQFDPNATNTSGSNIQLNDGLSPVFIVWEPTTTATNYNVSIFAEWRVIYNSDVQLASTQTQHPSTGAGIWQSIVNTASSVAGNVAAAASVVNSVGSAINDVSNIGKALTGASGNAGAKAASAGMGVALQDMSLASILLRI